MKPEDLLLFFSGGVWPHCFFCCPGSLWLRFTFALLVLPQSSLRQCAFMKLWYLKFVQLVELSYWFGVNVFLICLSSTLAMLDSTRGAFFLLFLLWIVTYF